MIPVGKQDLVGWWDIHWFQGIFHLLDKWDLVGGIKINYKPWNWSLSPHPFFAMVLVTSPTRSHLLATSNPLSWSSLQKMVFVLKLMINTSHFYHFITIYIYISFISLSGSVSPFRPVWTTSLWSSKGWTTGHPLVAAPAAPSSACNSFWLSRAMMTRGECPKMRFFSGDAGKPTCWIFWLMWLESDICSLNWNFDGFEVGGFCWHQRSLVIFWEAEIIVYHIRGWNFRAKQLQRGTFATTSTNRGPKQMQNM